MQLLLYFILALVLLCGLYINLIGAPGLWLMVFGTLAYAWMTGWQFAGWKSLLTVTILAGLAEVFEIIVAGAAARKAGASRAGLWGAIIGSIIGGILFTGLITIPIVGTVFGVCMGTFVGAIIGEMAAGTQGGDSLRIGLGAAKGRLMAIFVKLFFGCAIVGV